MKFLFIALEILGFLMIYLGFKTQGGLSIALGIGGLLLVIIVADLFSREKPTEKAENEQQQKPT